MQGIGIGIGIGVAIESIIVGILYFYMRKRARKHKNAIIVVSNTGEEPTTHKEPVHSDVGIHVDQPYWK